MKRHMSQQSQNSFNSFASARGNLSQFTKHTQKSINMRTKGPDSNVAAPRSSEGASDFQSIDRKSQGSSNYQVGGGTRKLYSRSEVRNDLIHLQRSKNRIKQSARKMKLLQASSHKKNRLLGGVP